MPRRIKKSSIKTNLKLVFSVDIVLGLIDFSVNIKLKDETYKWLE